MADGPPIHPQSRLMALRGLRALRGRLRGLRGLRGLGSRGTAGWPSLDALHGKEWSSASQIDLSWLSRILRLQPIQKPSFSAFRARFIGHRSIAVIEPGTLQSHFFKGMRSANVDSRTPLPSCLTRVWRPKTKPISKRSLSNGFATHPHAVSGGLFTFC